MMMKLWFGTMGISLLVFNVGCSQGAPSAPSSLASHDLGVASESVAATTYSYPVVRFEPDLLAYPATVTVPVGDKILMVNNTNRYVLVRSYNCGQFSSMGLQPGVSRHTTEFYPAGKTCNYFVWDYPQKILQGQVIIK